MSNFACEKCGAHIIDSPKGYITGCEHYPLSGENKVKSAWGTVYYEILRKGFDNGYAAYKADEYCARKTKDATAEIGPLFKG